MFTSVYIYIYNYSVVLVFTYCTFVTVIIFRYTRGLLCMYTVVLCLFIKKQLYKQTLSFCQIHALQDVEI